LGVRNHRNAHYPTPDNTYTQETSTSGSSDYLLSNGDLELGGPGYIPYGYSSGGSEYDKGAYKAPYQTTWSISGTTPDVGSHDESEAFYNVSSGSTVYVYGDWVNLNGGTLGGSVPEPTAYGAIAGAGLLVVSLRRQFSRKAA
jgi:hypothetical protein